MTQVVTLLWLGAPALLDAHAAALDAWAAAHQARWDPPGASHVTALERDGAVVEDVEQSLEEARVAGASLDDRRARRALEVAADALLAHPELPEAAWLLASRHRLLAEVVARAHGDATSVRSLMEAAYALEGARARQVEAAAPEPPTPASVTVRARGLRAGQSLWLDGLAVSSEFHAAPGQHQLRVERDGVTVWAAWIEARGAKTQINVAAPDAEPCSDVDLAGVKAARGGLDVPASVRCEEWIAARPGARGSVWIASCAGPRCGAETSWRAVSLPLAPTPIAPAARGGPTWVTWTLLGATAAAFGTVLLWQAGAFGEEPTPPPRWQYQGPH